MHRIRRSLAVAVAAAALIVLPANVLASSSYSQGATVAVTDAHLLAKVGVVVDIAATCQPLNGVTQLYPQFVVTITQRVKKTVAQETGVYNARRTRP